MLIQKNLHFQYLHETFKQEILNFKKVLRVVSNHFDGSILCTTHKNLNFLPLITNYPD